MSASCKPMKHYTLGEEIANAVSHGLGALLAIAGCVVLIVCSALDHSPLKVVTSSIFGASLILMFVMSTMYHALSNRKAKSVFRIFDHNAIFLLIAGTYTPLTLVALQGWIGWAIFGVVWAATILGIVLNSINMERFKKFSMVCYLVTGWCIIVAIVPLIQHLNLVDLIFLLAGGIAYTVGILFYRLKSIQYMHSIWHLFVLAGAVCHYFCVLNVMQ